jgi:CDP-diacylglycerol--serine O-phosphatidyltransferase
MKKIYLVPNFITTANLFSGFYSVVASTHRDFAVASWAIVAAGIFDMLDGRIARLAKATSQFGVEYDSLSDLLSFGVAPAILLYQWALEPYDRLGWLGAFLFLTCGAFRLARFNVNTQNQPKNYFQGLPIPLAAGMVATFVLFSQAIQWDTANQSSLVLVLTFGLSGLMVSTVPFPSFKELNWRSKATFGYLLIGVLFMIFIAVKPDVTLFVSMSCFIGVSLLRNLIKVVMQPGDDQSRASLSRSDERN